MTRSKESIIGPLETRKFRFRVMLSLLSVDFVHVREKITTCHIFRIIGLKSLLGFLYFKDLRFKFSPINVILKADKILHVKVTIALTLKVWSLLTSSFPAGWFVIPDSTVLVKHGIHVGFFKDGFHSTKIVIIFLKVVFYLLVTFTVSVRVHY